MVGTTKKIEISCNGRVVWVLRYRIPQEQGPHPILLMLHGWTVDEDAMWIYASRLPANWLLISPLGIFDSPAGGYGWHKYNENSWPELDDFKPVVDALHDLLSRSCFPSDEIQNADLSQFRLVGFSQGAALAYSFAILYPEKVLSIAGLSGFLPENSGKYIRKGSLSGKRIFITHGSRDHLVDVERARESVNALKSAGAEVIYCEEDVGHKLSASCFRSMENFFKTDIE
jgi:phospholipase/carboxylesterase